MSYQQPPQFEPGQQPQPQQNGQGYNPPVAPGYQPPASFQGLYGYVGPQQFQPLSPWNYFWHWVLFNIPIIGWIFLIVDCFTSRNYNLRSFARSFFCYAVLILIVAAIIAIIMAAAGYSFSPASGFNMSV